MTITVFGSGYVGLVTAACFAAVGNSVICVDIDEERIANLKSGLLPIFEPGLKEMILKSLNTKCLSFTTDSVNAIQQADIIFIAVGTPAAKDGSADITAVVSVAKNIAQHLNCYKVIVNKSTVPIGTADKIKAVIDSVISNKETDFSIDVVSNPEFLKEGNAIEDFLKPDRIIIGSSSDRAIKILKELYAPFNRSHDRIIVMDRKSAEMTKYAANAMLATKISFMNEMSQIAERVGADIEEVRRGIGTDKRIGFHFIYPGCGFGGSCFPKDIVALHKIAKDYSYDAKILHAVNLVNAEQKHKLFEKINCYFKANLEKKTFAIWGLAFKPNTDDIREAPARVLIEQLWEKNACVKIFDPQASANFQKLYGARPDYTICDSHEEALMGADALVIVTEWSVFRSPNFYQIKKSLVNPVIFDGRNLFKPGDLQDYGIDYISIGRQPSCNDTEENSSRCDSVDYLVNDMHVD